MLTSEIKLGGRTVRFVTVQTLIVGSGAASLNCAEHLFELGVKDVAIVTDRLGGGTSRNSGSDKQTYYRMSVASDAPDSPVDFARTLTAGGMMHGDIAYIEGLGSVPEFAHLVRNGVPFPCNKFGAYVGYKTYHDPRQRGTSAGPKTSWHMFEGSMKQIGRNGTPILDKIEVVALLTAPEGEGTRVVGAVAIDLTRASEPGFGLVLFRAENVVLGTGGPGEMYKISVYPKGQVGSMGLALEAGALSNNLLESQFGLATIGFRWNVSGTYQQVVPSHFSTKPDGTDTRYFLNEYFDTMEELVLNTFLKGYQWPFHAERTQNGGSSIVDIAVHNEIQAGRKVFMDFRENPPGGAGLEPFTMARLTGEAKTYLERSGALQATPIERLLHMNPLSIDIYTEHGFDPAKDPLEVAVCAQHNNGGLSANIWWESNLKHLFPIGEICGTHGVRPGGSALNSGQVGGMRAAQFIARRYTGNPPALEAFLKLSAPQVDAVSARLQRHLGAGAGALGVEAVRSDIQSRMSEAAAHVRSSESVRSALDAGRKLMERVRREGQKLSKPSDLRLAVENDHMLLAHLAFLETIRFYIEARGGGSRGGYMILDPKGARKVTTRKGTGMPHRPENMALRAEILETAATPAGEITVRPIPVRPIPKDDSWFETTWNEWMRGAIYE